MRRSGLVLVSLVAFASLVACSGGDPSAEAPSTYREALADVLCATYECPMTMSFLAASRLEMGDAAGCRRAAERLFLQGGTVPIEEAIARGTVVFDADAAEACREAVLTRCDGALEEIEACKAMLTGTLPEGAGCTVDEECLVGSCAGSSGASCGVCTRGTTPLGGACVTADDCAPLAEGEADCVEDEMTFAWTCAPAVRITVVPSGIGGPCDVPVGDDGIARCGVGAYCDENDRCRAPLAIDAPCEDHVDACVPEAVCSQAPGDTEYRCRVIAVAHEEGAPCDVEEPALRRCSMMDNLECDPTLAVCTRIGTGALGEGCTSHIACNDGLFCAQSGSIIGECVARFADGIACTSGAECTSGYCPIEDGAQAGVCTDRAVLSSCAN